MFYDESVKSLFLTTEHTEIPEATACNEKNFSVVSVCSVVNL
jgi:hypothetical protein